MLQANEQGLKHTLKLIFRPSTAVIFTNASTKSPPKKDCRPCKKWCKSSIRRKWDTQGTQPEKRQWQLGEPSKYLVNSYIVPDRVRKKMYVLSFRNTGNCCDGFTTLAVYFATQTNDNTRKHTHDTLTHTRHDTLARTFEMTVESDAPGPISPGCVHSSIITRFTPPCGRLKSRYIWPCRDSFWRHD